MPPRKPPVSKPQTATAKTASNASRPKSPKKSATPKAVQAVPVSAAPPKTAKGFVPASTVRPITEAAQNPDVVRTIPKNIRALSSSYSEITRLHGTTLSAGKGSLVLTSATQKEGTTTLARLMAQRSAENGSRTLLVDLNLKNAALTTSFGFTPAIWKLSARKASDLPEDLIHPVLGTDNLFVLPAPTDEATIRFLKNPARAQQFFFLLERKYDHIIIDTTPVDALNRQNVDPVILAAAARRTILVFLAARTPREKIVSALDNLKRADATLEGVVANDYLNPSVQNELLAMLAPLRRFVPGLHAWLRHKVLAMPELG